VGYRPSITIQSVTFLRFAMGAVDRLDIPTQAERIVSAGVGYLPSVLILGGAWLYFVPR